MLIGNSSATNASVNIFFVISVYILVFNVYCLSSILFCFVLLSFVLFCFVLFCFILFCKDINKTQSAPRFSPKRAWGNLYYYRFHLFFTFFRYPALLSFTHDKSFYHAMCCPYHAICYPSSCYIMFFIAHFQFFYLQL